MFRNLRMAPLTVCTLVLALASSQAQAQVVPFKVTGSGIVNYIPLPGDDPQYHFAVGEATHLGKYFGEGFVQTDVLTSPTTALFSSAKPFVFVGANGDHLAFHYGRTDFGAEQPGLVTLVPAGDGKFFAVFVAEFNPVLAECTGKYKDLVQERSSFIMIAVSDPFVVGAKDPVGYSWAGAGNIEFKKGK